MSKALITTTIEGIRLNLRVSSGAKRTSIEGPYGPCALRLKVAAPPVSGKANAEAERFLAELLGVPRSNVAVTRGASSRDKVVLIRGLEHTRTFNLLSPYLR